MNRYNIHPFEPTLEQFRAVAALQQAAALHRRPVPAEELQQDHAEWPPEFLNQRFVAVAADGEGDGRMIATAACYEPFWQQKTGSVYLEFTVHPQHPQSVLLPLLLAAVTDFLGQVETEVKALECRAREDHLERIQFLQEQGFQPVMRSPASRLQVAGFDAARFQKYGQLLRQKGLQILTLSQLMAQEPNWKEKSRALRWALLQDVPATEPLTEPTLEDFQRMVLDDPALDPEAFFVAVDPQEGDGVGAFIGMSNLWLNDPDRKRLDTGLTGTVRTHRRQGIATALKVRTIEFAQAIGAEEIVTSNEENNPMYLLNSKLGFTPLPAWISYRKELQPA